MKVILYDAKHHYLLRRISKNLRLAEKLEGLELREILAPMETCPDELEPIINEVWYMGVVLTELSQLFSGKIFNDGDEFIFDTDNEILNIVLDKLVNDRGITITKSDIQLYRRRFAKWL